MRETVLKSAVKLHHSDINRKRKQKAKAPVPKTVLKQVPLPPNQFTKLKVTMMMNGPHLLSLIQSFLKKKKSFKK
jgi:hypothetical protein